MASGSLQFVKSKDKNKNNNSQQEQKQKKKKKKKKKKKRKNSNNKKSFNELVHKKSSNELGAMLGNSGHG